MMTPEEQKIVDKISMSRSELFWGVVLYGIIMWAAGFTWARMVL